MKLFPTRLLQTRPIRAEAIQYTGTIDSGDYLIGWVKATHGNQKLYFEKENRLVLLGPEGTTDVFEQWWLVKDANNFFEALTSEELTEKYANYVEQG